MVPLLGWPSETDSKSGFVSWEPAQIDVGHIGTPPETHTNSEPKGQTLYAHDYCGQDIPDSGLTHDPPNRTFFVPRPSRVMFRAEKTHWKSFSTVTPHGIKEVDFCPYYFDLKGGGAPRPPTKTFSRVPSRTVNGVHVLATTRTMPTVSPLPSDVGPYHRRPTPWDGRHSPDHPPRWRKRVVATSGMRGGGVGFWPDTPYPWVSGSENQD